MSVIIRWLPFLIFVALLIAMLWGGWNWRTHHEHQYAAEKRGWRYHPSLISAVFGRPFRVAGTTPSGAVWEMMPIQHDGRLAFEWYTKQATLPYGQLKILPRDVATTIGQTPLRLLPAGSRQWQKLYAVLVTHDQLAEKVITSALEQDLAAWPAWPAPGALAEVVITPNHLKIIAHQQPGWLGRDRVAALGDLLTAVLAPSS